MTFSWYPKSHTAITEYDTSSLISHLHKNFVISGFDVSVSSGLDISITSGTALISGELITSDATETKTMTDNSTNFVYIEITARDATTSNVSTVEVTAYTSEQSETDRVLIAKVYTSGGSITSIDSSVKREVPVTDDIISIEDDMDFNGNNITNIGSNSVNIDTFYSSYQSHVSDTSNPHSVTESQIYPTVLPFLRDGSRTITGNIQFASTETVSIGTSSVRANEIYTKSIYATNIYDAGGGYSLASHASRHADGGSDALPSDSISTSMIKDNAVTSDKLTSDDSSLGKITSSRLGVNAGSTYDAIYLNNDGDYSRLFAFKTGALTKYFKIYAYGSTSATEKLHITIDTTLDSLGTDLMILDENGNLSVVNNLTVGNDLTVDSDLQVNGNNIKDSGGTTRIQLGDPVTISNLTVTSLNLGSFSLTSLDADNKIHDSTLWNGVSRTSDQTIGGNVTIGSRVLPKNLLFKALDSQSTNSVSQSSYGWSSATEVAYCYIDYDASDITYGNIKIMFESYVNTSSCIWKVEVKDDSGNVIYSKDGSNTSWAETDSGWITLSSTTKKIHIYLSTFSDGSSVTSYIRNKRVYVK